jgi:hypothetical protein
VQRTCKDRHPDPAQTQATCRLCWLALNDARYQKLWGEPITAPDTPQPFAPVLRPRLCLHLGEQVQVAGSIRNWHACRKGHGTVCPCGACKTCPDYEAGEDDDPAPRRHALLHVLPVAGNGAWQRACDQLRWRERLFTGRKVVAVCTGSGYDPPAPVAEYLPGWEVLTVPNNPALREVATWRPLWERVEEFSDTDDPVFYCHAKAVTRPWNPGVSCHPWARVLFSSLLDFWPIVEGELARWPIAGSFKKVGRGFTGSKSRWHYSGSFFWIRASEAFKHGRWLDIDAAWWGNESWPGRHFPPEHAGVVFKEGTVPSLNLYEPRYLFGTILQEFRQWSHANAHRRTP